jgi:23S rRNA (cytosine1962-C5)-methyltransferase
MFPILTIQKGKERVMHNRHPWIFSGAVAQIPQVENGDIVDIRTIEGNRIGYGFYSPDSQIICRVFEYSDQVKDVKSSFYWKEKLGNALILRKLLIQNSNTNSYRLIHAEGDFIPGLIADVYNQTVVLQFLIKGTEKLKPIIVEALTGLGFQYIFDKSKEITERLEGVEGQKGWLSEKKGHEKIKILENGVKFWVDILEGQKTGFFLDQRDARQLLEKYCQNKKVLNTFCYSGGFSMYALRGGAKLVHSVDASQPSLTICDENVVLNDFTTEKHQSICADCFDYLKDMKENEYDVIILDPPAFAKHAKAVENAAKGYKELNMKALKKIKKGGILFTFSCSQKVDRDLFRKIVFSAAADTGRNVRILHQTTQPADHPINIYHPENEYLKGLALYVD